MPKVSVIVPVYNVEKYLPTCLDSLVQQTLKEIEIIVVNDGSTDNSLSIMQQYAKKYPDKIKIYSKENGGLSDARNAGMKIANGEYISFIDSDDYISCDFIETLYNVMKAEKSDIVECDTVRFEDGATPSVINDNCEVNSFSAEKGLSLLITEDKFHQHVWNKLYKLSLIHI